MTVRLAPLAQAAPHDVEALLDAAFGADRRARTAYRLREGLAPLADLSFAAFERLELVGILQSWPVSLDDAPLTLVGPVAVSPSLQNAGLGTRLMETLLDAAGNCPLCMIGDPDYYGRFGFTATSTGGWSLPGPVERHRLLARNAAALARAGQLHAGAKQASSLDQSTGWRLAG